MSGQSKAFGATQALRTASWTATSRRRGRPAACDRHGGRAGSPARPPTHNAWEETVMSADIEARLRRLEDLEAIRRLFAEYRRALDEKDFDKYCRLFTEDGVFVANGRRVPRGHPRDAARDARRRPERAAR